MNGLSRCSPCMANCQTCTDNSSCLQCQLGLHYSAGQCQTCNTYCLNCTASVCFNCVQGYAPSVSVCIDCSIPMPRCLLCSSAAVCSLCESTYIFKPSTRQCVLCSSLMANCLLCNFTNNCQKCQSGYYSLTFKQCGVCTFDVEVCCGNYVDNCRNCLS